MPFQGSGGADGERGPQLLGTALAEPGPGAVITKEPAGDIGNRCRWRVVGATSENKDGHARSYEIVPGPTTRYPGRGCAKHDLHVPQCNPCGKTPATAPGPLTPAGPGRRNGHRRPRR
ncbi:hypothetical protein [Streptomyces sp. enrichment culture]|uniref:hypothetical protein n=1 Tax=Streptomyces sp. enrichment culture TaxID=1795815 RepID=UPI003F54E2E6